MVGAGFSDDVSHIPLGVVSRSLSRVMTRGFEMCVLEGTTNVWSVDGSGPSGCESFTGVRCNGIVDGD